MKENAAHIMQMRWCEAEERYGKLESILTELDEIDEIDEVREQVSLKNTKAYMLIEKEMDLLAIEMHFIEKTGALSG